MSGKLVYEGKSKRVYEDGANYIIEFKNTATAFNGEKKEELENKGLLNAAISNLIYEYLGDNGVKHHLLKSIDATRISVRRAEIIPVEVIIRNVAAGGFSKKYGAAEGSPLRNVVLEYCLKNDALGDPMMNETQITAIGLASAAELKIMAAAARKINKLLLVFFKKAGIKLVDFKLEFGRADGEVILCDEISPDSCRLWDLKTGEKMDKDRFRRNMGGVMDGYKKVLNRIGKKKTR